VANWQTETPTSLPTCKKRARRTGKQRDIKDLDAEIQIQFAGLIDFAIYV
jgi:hypothetical protein